jgi:hypothetical protein
MIKPKEGAENNKNRIRKNFFLSVGKNSIDAQWKCGHC